MPIKKCKNLISGKCMLTVKKNTMATNSGDFDITIRLPYIYKK